MNINKIILPIILAYSSVFQSSFSMNNQDIVANNHYSVDITMDETVLQRITFPHMKCPYPIFYYKPHQQLQDLTKEFFFSLDRGMRNIFRRAFYKNGKLICNQLNVMYGITNTIFENMFSSLSKFFHKNCSMTRKYEYNDDHHSQRKYVFDCYLDGVVNQNKDNVHSEFITTQFIRGYNMHEKTRTTKQRFFIYPAIVVDPHKFDDKLPNDLYMDLAYTMEVMWYMLSLMKADTSYMRIHINKPVIKFL